MAKTLVPSYVAQALAADRSQQVSMVAALVVYLFGEAKANREISEFGATLFKASPHRSLKTWQNYATACAAVASTQTVKLEALWLGHSDPAECVAPLAQWLTHELKTRKYQTSMEDISNWTKGRPSMAVKAKADEAAEKAAIKAQAEADAKARQEQQTQAQAEDEAQKLIDAAKKTPDPMPMGDEDGTQATGYPPAIEAPAADSAPVFLLSAALEKDGSVKVTLADSIDRETLQAVIDALQAQCDMMAPAVALAFPVLETAEA